MQQGQQWRAPRACWLPPLRCVPRGRRRKNGGNVNVLASLPLQREGSGRSRGVFVSRASEQRLVPSVQRCHSINSGQTCGTDLVCEMREAIRDDPSNTQHTTNTQQTTHHTHTTHTTHTNTSTSSSSSSINRSIDRSIEGSIADTVGGGTRTTRVAGGRSTGLSSLVTCLRVEDAGSFGDGRKRAGLFAVWRKSMVAKSRQGCVGFSLATFQRRPEERVVDGLRGPFSDSSTVPHSHGPPQHVLSFALPTNMITY